MAAHPAAEPLGLALGSRVPGSKGTKGGTWALRLPGSTMAGWAKEEVSYGTGHQTGTLHRVTAKPLAPLGSLCGGSLGAPRLGAAHQLVGHGLKGGALLTQRVACPCG